VQTATRGNARSEFCASLARARAPPRQRRRTFGRERACSFGGPAATGGRTQIDGAATRARCGGGCETAPRSTPPPVWVVRVQRPLWPHIYPRINEYYVHRISHGVERARAQTSSLGVRDRIAASAARGSREPDESAARLKSYLHINDIPGIGGGGGARVSACTHDALLHIYIYIRARVAYWGRAGV